MMSRAAAYLGRAPVSRVATRAVSNVRVAALSSLRRCLHGLSTPQPRRRRDHLRKLRAGDSALPSSWDALGIWPRAQTRRRSLGTSQRRGDAFFPTWCESMRLSGLPASGEQNGGLKSAEWGPAPGETARWRHSPMFRRHRRAMFNGLGTTRSRQYFNLSSPNERPHTGPASTRSVASRRQWPMALRRSLTAARCALSVRVGASSDVATEPG